MTTLFDQRLLRFLVIFIVFGTQISGVAESADPEKINIKITFRSQLYGDASLKGIKLNHPIKISYKEIINHLISLKYKGTFLGDNEGHVFSLLEVKKLAPVLKKAFASISPGKVIHVKLNSKNGITSCDVFSFRKYLNWRFESIQGETFLQRNDSREWNIYSWQLIPKADQRYFKTKFDKRINKNWVVSNLKSTVIGRNHSKERGLAAKANTKPLNHKVNPILEEKLEHLKYLYDKKLITEEEYKAQQKRVFDELF